MSHKIPIYKKTILISSFLLIGVLIYRLIDQSKMLYFFPLDYVNDVSSYMAQLHFLKVCGFHKFCPYWYNGFTTFNFSPPGWYFLTLPLYLFFGKVTTATYISIIFSLIGGFILIYKLGHLASLSRIDKITLFALFFGNASAIGNFIRLGRAPELLSWIIFIPLFLILYSYRKKKIDNLFYISSLLYALIIITYHSTGVLSLFLWLGFFLTRESILEKLKVTLTIIMALAISSFWLLPFITNIFKKSAIPYLKQGTWIWNSSLSNLSINIAVFIIPLIFLILSYLYFKGENKNKKNLLFFLPTIIFGILFFLRLTPLIPIFDQIYPDPIIHYLIFFGVFFLLKIDYNQIRPRIIKISNVAIILIVLISILISLFYTPYFKVPDSQIEKEFISYLPLLNERFVIVGDYPEGPYSKAFYSFAAVYNKKSVSGWYPEEKEYQYIQRLQNIHDAFNEKDCIRFRQELNYFNTTEVLTTKGLCAVLKSCDLNEVTTKEATCLYKTK